MCTTHLNRTLNTSLILNKNKDGTLNLYENRTKSSTTSIKMFGCILLRYEKIVTQDATTYF